MTAHANPTNDVDSNTSTSITSQPISHGFSASTSVWNTTIMNITKASTTSNDSSASITSTASTASNSTDSSSTSSPKSTSPTPTFIGSSFSIESSITSGSGNALEALATLASNAHSRLSIPPTTTSNINIFKNKNNFPSIKSKTDDDLNAMPPPPPRRLRSVSNPEGMEKWDKYSYSKSVRRHFVLPTSILEEELASVTQACQLKKQEQMSVGMSINDGPLKKQGMTVFGIGGSGNVEAAEGGGGMPLATSSSSVNTENMTPEELLRHARSRVLEDLSMEMGDAKNGVMPLPHSLDKYKEIYNKNGRIGIYTPAERAAIIAKFNSKRTRRVWNKKIRYNCRKNLADRRERVKGRFVKRTDDASPDTPLAPVLEEECTADDISTTLTTTSSVGSTVEEPMDMDMPDTNDPEAGFRPTTSQPYRRVRRHTIT